MGRSGDGFPELTCLTSHNSKLRAVSVEYTGPCDLEGLPESVEAFVDVMFQFSDITCVYLEGMSWNCSKTEQLCAELWIRSNRTLNRLKGPLFRHHAKSRERGVDQVRDAHGLREKAPWC